MCIEWISFKRRPCRHATGMVAGWRTDHGGCGSVGRFGAIISAVLAAVDVFTASG